MSTQEAELIQSIIAVFGLIFFINEAPLNYLMERRGRMMFVILHLIFLKRMKMQ